MSNEKKLDEILSRLKKLERLPQTTENLSKSIDTVVQSVNKLHEKTDGIAEENEKLKKTVVYLEGKVDYIENQTRRNNLVIRGLKKEVQEERWDDVEQLVRKMLREELGVKTADGDIERAHRLGRSKAREDKPIVVKFTFFKKKEEILKNANKLKGTNILIMEDFSDRVIQERRKLLPLLKEARNKDERAVLTYNKLRIGNQVFVYDRVLEKVVKLGGQVRQEVAVDSDNDYSSPQGEDDGGDVIVAGSSKTPNKYTLRKKK